MSSSKADRTFGTLAAALAGAVLVTGVALAGHDEPKKAQAATMRLVTTFDACEAPDAVTGGAGLPACAAVATDTQCGIDPKKGHGTISANVLGNADILVKVSVTGLTNCDGETLRPSAVVQVTTDNCVGHASCTTTLVSTSDLPGTGLGACVVQKGRCHINTTFNTAAGADILAPGSKVGIEVFDCGLDRITSGGVPIDPAVPTLSCGLLSE